MMLVDPLLTNTPIKIVLEQSIDGNPPQTDGSNYDLNYQITSHNSSEGEGVPPTLLPSQDKNTEPDPEIQETFDSYDKISNFTNSICERSPIKSLHASSDSILDLSNSMSYYDPDLQPDSLNQSTDLSSKSLSLVSSKSSFSSDDLYSSFSNTKSTETKPDNSSSNQISPLQKDNTTQQPPLSSVNRQSSSIRSPKSTPKGRRKKLQKPSSLTRDPISEVPEAPPMPNHLHYEEEQGDEQQEQNEYDLDDEQDIQELQEVEEDTTQLIELSNEVTEDMETVQFNLLREKQNIERIKLENRHKKEIQDLVDFLKLKKENQKKTK